MSRHNYRYLLNTDKKKIEFCCDYYVHEMPIKEIAVKWGFPNWISAMNKIKYYMNNPDIKFRVTIKTGIHNKKSYEKKLRLDGVHFGHKTESYYENEDDIPESTFGQMFNYQILDDEHERKQQTDS